MKHRRQTVVRLIAVRKSAHTILAVGVALLAIGCGTNRATDSSANKSPARVEYVPSDDHFVNLLILLDPSAEMDWSESRDIKSLKKKKTFWQEGTIDGHPYRFYSDGSGSFGRTTSKYRSDNWTVRCRVDRMRDTRSCTTRKGDLSIYVASNSLTFVSIGHTHYPGTGIMIRIGGGTPISTEDEIWSQDEAKRLIRKLLTAISVVTRYQEWPYEVYKDRAIQMDGFSSAYRYINWAVARQPQ